MRALLDVKVCKTLYFKTILVSRYGTKHEISYWRRIEKHGSMRRAKGPAEYKTINTKGIEASTTMNEKIFFLTFPPALVSFQL
jgi:hypothetical protein